MAGYEPGAGRPKLQNWLNLVKQKTNPHYDDAHKILYKLTGQQAQEPVAAAASTAGNDAIPKLFKN